MISDLLSIPIERSSEAVQEAPLSEFLSLIIRQISSSAVYRSTDTTRAEFLEKQVKSRRRGEGTGIFPPLQTQSKKISSKKTQLLDGPLLAAPRDSLRIFMLFHVILSNRISGPGGN